MNRKLNEAVSASFYRPNEVGRKPELVSSQSRELLNLGRLPAMLNIQQTAVLLGVAEHDIAPLVREGLLQPLGNPPANAVKYFAAYIVLEIAADIRRLDAIRNALYAHWHSKNSSKHNGSRKPTNRKH